MDLKIPRALTNIQAPAVEQPFSGAGLTDMRLKKAVYEFEALFITQLFQEMRKTIHSSGLTERSSGPDRIYEGLLDEQLGFSLSQGRGIGLAQALLRQLQQSSGQVLPQKGPEA